MVWVSRGLTVVAFLLAGGFMVAYHALAQWWRTEGGRHVMSWMAVSTLLLGLSSARIVFGPGYPGSRAVTVVALACLVWVILRRWWLMLRAQRVVKSRRGKP